MLGPQKTREALGFAGQSVGYGRVTSSGDGGSANDASGANDASDEHRRRLQIQRC